MGHLEDSNAYPIVRQLLGALPPGSYLALYDGGTPSGSDAFITEAQEEGARRSLRGAGSTPDPRWPRSPQPDTVPTPWPPGSPRSSHARTAAPGSRVLTTLIQQPPVPQTP